MTPGPYRLEPITSKRTLTDFIRAPHRIYRDDPNWVPPLDFERRDALSKKHPFNLHAEWQGWVAYRGDEPAGRITAQIDRLYLERHDPHTGFFGLIEGDDDPALFAALTGMAEAWLKERGMNRILGPFNLNVNQEVGLLVDGFDTPPYFLMGHARPYYQARLLEQGYAGCQDMLAYLTPTDYEKPRLFQRQLTRVLREITVRPLNRRRKDEELEAIRDIFNDAWSGNWSFVPFTREEFKAVGSELMLLLPDDYVMVAEHAGEPVGFMVLVPNLNEAIADLGGRLLPFGWAKLLWRVKVAGLKTGRVPLMGVRKRYHHTSLGPGIAMAVISAVQESALRRGMKMAETSWILESNAGMRSIMELIGGTVSKRYRMFEKALT
jgi:hypothetical protein